MRILCGERLLGEWKMLGEILWYLALQIGVLSESSNITKENANPEAAAERLAGKVCVDALAVGLFNGNYLNIQCTK